MSMISTVGAPLKCVTPSAATSRHTSAGSTRRSSTWRLPAPVSAHGKHQPLQWKSGSVQRKTDDASSRWTTISESAFRYDPRCVYMTPFGRPVVPEV